MVNYMSSIIYGQTEYNILSNALHVEDYVREATHKGYSALTLTDSNLFCAYKFINLCNLNNIKPIVGLEIKYNHNDFRGLILAYARNLYGYKELVEISTNNKLYDKIYDLEELTEFKNLIFISTYYDSEFCNKSEGELSELISSYLNLSNFSLGLELNKGNNCDTLYNFALNNNIKVYPLSKTLYNEENDRILYETICKIGDNKISNGNYSYYSLVELKTIFNNYKIVLENLNVFESMFETYDLKAKISVPHYKNNLNMSSKDYLSYLCNKGLNKRLSNQNVDKSVYNNRLDMELNVINKMGFDDYFLIVWDYVLYAKKNDVLVGPGRGSACSSLVAYSLGITNVDPLKYNLLFERFLNIERVTMPDIDIDFPDDKRNFVLEYVKNKYGENYVASITAFSTIQKKSIIRDLGKLLNIDSQKIKVISNSLSNTDIDSLLTEYKNDEEIYNYLSLAKRLEGYPKTLSTHASGIIISEEPLTNYVALSKGSLNLYQTQFESDDLAKIGLLKMDFLVLRNLTLIANSIKYIPSLDNINLINIPLNDKKTFDMLSKADTMLIFQLESDGIRKVIRQMKPSNINDIIALLALYRPGPMDQIENYINRKNGAKFSYISSDLEPILKDTYGIIVYQEQIMQIAHSFAGLSLGEADILRRAVSKKKEEVLIKERENFVSHALKKGYSKEISNAIYDDIVKFAEYGFNKAHAVGYAILSYQMAYLKANYLSEFMTSALNLVGAKSEIKKYIKYLKMKQVKLLSPDINKSSLEFELTSDGIRIPLTEINYISKQKVKEIIDNRGEGYLSLNDFKNKNNLSEEELNALIFTNAFSSFNTNKRNLFNNKKVYNYLDDIIEDDTEFDFDFLQEKELYYLGYNIVYDLFNDISDLYKNYKCSNIKSQVKQRNIITIVEFSDIKEITTKKGDKMLVGNLTDSFIELPFVIFPKTYAMHNNIMLNKLYIINGSFNKDNYNKLNISINNLKLLDKIN